MKVAAETQMENSVLRCRAEIKDPGLINVGNRIGDPLHIKLDPPKFT